MSTSVMSLRIDSETRTRLDRLAKLDRRSSHAIALDAIAEHLDRREDLAAWDESCQAARAHYLETGLHVTGDEVDQWLASWGTDNELAPPECHI